MTETPKTKRSFRSLRVALILIGGLMILVALGADRLGLGSRGSVGIGQILLAATGLMLVSAGAFGRRFISIYRTTAVLILNTIILLILLELVAIVVGRTLFRAGQSEIETLRYYRNQEWAEIYWQEALGSLEFRYKPYRIWEKKPFAGKTVNFDAEGTRKTPGAECASGAYTVYTFGGSTMVGWGAPDWGTIPAYLQSKLANLMDGPVCVINFGEDGYVSTQSLITLLVKLQRGERPDAVIFYDGINDVLAAHESGQAGAHVTLAKIAAIFEGQEHPLLAWAKGTRTFALVRYLGERLALGGIGTTEAFRTRSGSAAEERNLANSVSQIYLSNYQIVGALSQEYHFHYSFYLQPHPAVTGKQLTDEESKMLSKMDPGLSDLARAIYREIALEAPERKNLWYIADVFDSEQGQVWIDDVGHVTPEGNRIVAGRMLRVLEKQLSD